MEEQESAMTQVRDYQKSACYAWEREVIAPRGGAFVEFEKAQDLVNWIWNEEGLSYPPVIERLHQNNTTAEATGGRMMVHIRDRVQTWVVLHELAHSMTSNIDGRNVGHRAIWVGVYMKLASKYLGIPLLILTATAARRGIAFDITALPIFLD
jgi:hypothetical protein